MSDAEKVAVPVTVKAAIGVQIAGAVVNLSTTTLTSMVDIGPGSVVGLIVGVGIAYLILRAIYASRHWVRVLLTVFAALGTLLLLLDLLTRLFGYSWFDLIGIVMVDTAVVLLWLPASRAYFGAVKQARIAAAANEPPSAVSRT